MAYYTDLFSPETYEAFTRSDRAVSGFQISQHGTAQRIKPGDKFVCYMTKLSRWIGILEVASDCYVDESPIFYPENDPFVVRFRVRATAWLPRERCVPIHNEAVWDALSFTKDKAWTGLVRRSLNRMSDADGEYLEQLLQHQHGGGKEYPVDESKFRKLVGLRIRRADKDVAVTVPDDDGDEEIAVEEPIRQSSHIQALLAKCGERMGFKIWLPKNDRFAVLQEWSPEILRPVFSLLERAPLSESCTFISYDSLEELLQMKHLSHLSDSVLEEYAEEAQ